MNIRLHIERLVLEGLPLGAHQGASVQATVQAELCRLLGAGALSGCFRQTSVATYVRADKIHLRSEMGAREIGHQIALSVYEAITK